MSNNWLKIYWRRYTQLNELGNTGKYQHLVSEVPLGCALRNSLNLILVLLSSHLGTDSVQCNAVQWEIKLFYWAELQSTNSIVEKSTISAYLTASALKHVLKKAPTCSSQCFLILPSLKMSSSSSCSSLPIP